ncbi:hypothetical protein SEVIR_9G583900v4 [Setaria viridis]|uniref:Uncharacterized protein n=1 Tax=Setaria viridis TaxID=4556 RepID=A0A4U6TCW7_SETVI|nr:hypothetical protein SEVIR_9G583900v2 [Setaria viridis]
MAPNRREDEEEERRTETMDSRQAEKGGARISGLRTEVHAYPIPSAQLLCVRWPPLHSMRASRAAPATPAVLACARARFQRLTRVEGDSGSGVPRMWEATAALASRARGVPVDGGSGCPRVRHFRRNSSPWWLSKASKIWGHTFFLDFPCKSGVGSLHRLFFVLEFPMAGTRTAMVLVLAS